MRTFVTVFSVILVALTAVVPLAIAQNDDAKEWRINGVVEQKQPNQITIRTDNNRMVVVDTSHARRQLADSIKVGDRVSVVARRHRAPPNRPRRPTRAGNGSTARWP